ncbi:MAG: ABC transporter ATP-binding protein [Flavobacteriales bacterium]|jgi:putative ABC transport system ATP-binding protein|nr:ABC transporter ATP-binding protein [Flavobacteriales bacterium]MBK6893710.1 ABC transporter ATP-binding protein [Flavobacteriales bacterium]MBK7248579.1 ABC transporter ATP-binding protein [Flavobacteriales bacterium]MBK7287736.1 ABC transporter ATP-binding protein [Flavobacteriales bacterium]MBK9059193.1 ABC transporter ATP-binding protein [Flavobacteriales bacterium]
MSNENIITIEKVTKRFKVGEGEFTALKEIDLTVKKGEFAGLVGPSGSGKTTLLNIIGSLDSPTEGKASVLGHDIASLSHKQSAQLRNMHIGFIFQVYNLLPVYTVYENVEFALLLQKVGAAERKKAVMEALEWVGIAGLADKRPDKLSGGEGQRVAIARAMVKKPELLLADEPTANLDATNAHAILKTMVSLNKELGTTFLFSTHDEKVMSYLRRIIHLRDGYVEKDENATPASS